METWASLFIRNQLSTMDYKIQELNVLPTNRIIPALAKILCVGCGVIHDFHSDPLELCNTYQTAFRTSLSMLIALAGPAIRCPVSRGRYITCFTTDNDDDKKAWLIQLLESLITLLQEDRDLHLEVFATGGNDNCFMLDILRKLSIEQLEDLRPTTVIHEGCTGDQCLGGIDLVSSGRYLSSNHTHHSKPQPPG